MFPRHDIRIEKDYINANNDFEVFESDKQHIQDTIDARPGEWKEHPTDGVNITSYLNSSGMELTIKRRIMMELTNDRYPCDSPKVSYSQDGTLTVDPNIEL